MEYNKNKLHETTIYFNSWIELLFHKTRTKAQNKMKLKKKIQAESNLINNSSLRNDTHQNSMTNKSNHPTSICTHRWVDVNSNAIEKYLVEKSTPWMSATNDFGISFIFCIAFSLRMASRMGVLLCAFNGSIYDSRNWYWFDSNRYGFFPGGAIVFVHGKPSDDVCQTFKAQANTKTGYETETIQLNGYARWSGE